MRTRLQIVMLIAGLAIIGCSKQQQPEKKITSGNTSLITYPPVADTGKRGTPPPGDSSDTPPPPKPIPPRDTTVPPPPPPFDDGPCTDVYCTENIVEIELDVLDGAGSHVVLDAFHTEDMNGKVLNTNLYYYDSDRKLYVVFTDFWVFGHQNTNTQVRFVGIKGGVQVVNEVYSVSADCCHINKTSGKTVVTIP